MKKIFTLLAMTSLFAFTANAADSLDGCGLGWQITDQKTYTATTTRGTTNVVIPPVFGMTSGTIGCDKLEIGKKDKEGLDYVATNFEVLKSELATGEGEYVDAMAGSFGCDANSQKLGLAIQSNYDRVVAPAKDAVELYNGLKTIAKKACI